ncbi:SDR family NAD(P)-dependent oxidoreductase [Actinomadura parmotrematis]|uniref:SDR family oxidoreductase n=1 Tax=Actinomadura parmotrematis TaxID=2864039 RepID=A0ABS7G6R0_9ACTN|nr:SDR family NAD(P)-dependent oxidoreductase [Actinomadura parmotrematis]MBW8487497.1 SDR family oxidoreductase [Actinomadura parmotrematis]
MAGELDGRHALVTGGASGIGLECARALAGAGAAVTLVDVSAEAVAARAAELGGGARGIAADVTDEAQVEAAVRAAVEASGPLHAAVNSAGTGTFGKVTDLPADEWRRIIDLNLTGVFLSLKHEALHMADGGSIVNLASLNARQPGIGFAAYCASKAGVEMLTKCAAMDLGPRRVRVNAVAPGLIDTPLTAGLMGTEVERDYLDNIPLGRTGTTGDVAALVLFLASDASAWMTGDLLFVDGGAHTMRYPRMA